jgi:hypothetical protein
MNFDTLLDTLTPRIAALRRDLHAHPELAFGEWRTADVVAQHLAALGLTVHRGLAGTGVVASLQAGTSRRAIGLRADMDALPIEELNTFAHRSTRPGQMHACGHDGHVAMLLGAAEALVTLHQAGHFDGTVHFIFQPAEEHESGAKAMVAQGLFEKFPMGAVFGLHNWPGLPVGEMAVRAGPVMAGADRFEITLNGQGGHAAMPHQASDVVLAGAALVQTVQMLVSRQRDPLEPAVLSVARFHAGHIGTHLQCCPAGEDGGCLATGVRRHRTQPRDQGVLSLRARLSADPQYRGRGGALRCCGNAGTGRRTGASRSAAQHGRGGFRLSAAAAAGLLRLAGQRCRAGRLHAAQPHLRLQRRAHSAGHPLLGTSGRAGLAGRSIGSRP